MASYPEPDPSRYDDEAESDVGAVIEVVRAIRNLRAEFRIQPSQPLEALVDAPEIGQVFESEAEVIRTLARVEPLRLVSNGAGGEAGQEVSVVLSSGTVTVPLGGLVELDKEKTRLASELDQISVNLERLSTRLEDPDFLAKAPEEVVERERQRLKGMKGRRTRVVETLSRLG